MKSIRKNQKELDAAELRLTTMKIRATNSNSDGEKEAILKKEEEEKKIKCAEQIKKLKSLIDDFYQKEEEVQKDIADQKEQTVLDSGGSKEDCERLRKQEGNKVLLLPTSLANANEILLCGIQLMKENEKNNEIYEILNDFACNYLEKIYFRYEELRTMVICIDLAELISVADAGRLVDCLQENLIPILQRERDIKMESATYLGMIEILHISQIRQLEKLQNPESIDNLIGEGIIHETVPFFLQTIRIHSQFENMNYLMERGSKLPVLDSLEYRDQIDNDLGFFYLLHHAFFDSYITLTVKVLDEWEKGKEEEEEEEKEKEDENLFSDIFHQALSLVMMDAAYYNLENLDLHSVQFLKDNGNWVAMFQEKQKELPNEDREDQSIRQEDMINLNENLMYLVQSTRDLMLEILKLNFLAPTDPDTKLDNKSNSSARESNPSNAETRSRVPVPVLMPPQQMNMQRVTQINGYNTNNQNMLPGPQK